MMGLEYGYRCMNPQDKKYPIKPKHLDTSERPEGFGNILNYTQITLLWCVVDFCKHGQSWNPFTTNDFMAYINSREGQNSAQRIGSLLHFFEPILSALLSREYVDKENRDWKKGYIYTPTHFLITTYFMWNPAK